jgi:lipoate-protein ligase A
MAIDEALLENYKEGDRPVLRLYGWPQALSLGRFSCAKKSLNLPRLKENNIPFVRRISGGGVLVHGGELSYSLVLPRSFVQHRGVKQNYRYLCSFLIRLYEKLGYKADFCTDLQLEQTHCASCLGGTEAYDIMIEGKKMGGNAQRYTRHALLQHGTLPIKKYETEIEAFFVDDPGLQNAATLEGLDGMLSYEALSFLLCESFCESFGTSLIDEGLSPAEKESAQRLFNEKYSQPSWNIASKISATA